MARLTAMAAAIVCAWMGSTGCSTAPPIHVSEERTQTGAYIEHVPFYPQLAYQCGPASLASVLNYWGEAISPDDIAKVIYTPRLKGTLGVDMWSFAQAHHFRADMRAGSLADLYTLVRQQIPVIALLDLGYDWLPVPHFVVVVGIDPETGHVITYNAREYNSRIPYNTFVRAWRKTNFWTLIVMPKKREA